LASFSRIKSSPSLEKLKTGGFLHIFSKFWTIFELLVVHHQLTSFLSFCCNKRAVRYTSVPHSHRVQGRAPSQGVNYRQPNLTLLVADSKARTCDLLVTWRQPHCCSKAPLLSFWCNSFLNFARSLMKFGAYIRYLRNLSNCFLSLIFLGNFLFFL